MKIVIVSNFKIYRYSCNDDCDHCDMRYVCYTNRKNGELRLDHNPKANFDALRKTLNTFMQPETLCPFCWNLDDFESVRPIGDTCPRCGHYMTCEICHIEDKCKFAHDLYNTDGDCLFSK